MKRGATTLSCLIGVQKPSGCSSHDVVSAVRRVSGERRVGHTGTLDPFARGVLPLMLGPACRLDAFMVGHSKVYDVSIAFGYATSTADIQGEIIESAPCSEQLLQHSFARELLQSFVGTQQQQPPAYSAISVGGTRAYVLARKGVDVCIPKRTIEVYSAQLLACEQRIFPGFSHAVTTWSVRFHVSKGTYIRSLAQDVGKRAGCCAFAAELTRVRVGTIGLDQCVALEQLSNISADEPIPGMLDPVQALQFPVIELSSQQLTRVLCGNELSLRACSVSDCKVCETPALETENASAGAPEIANASAGAPEPVLVSAGMSAPQSTPMPVSRYYSLVAYTNGARVLQAIYKAADDSPYLRAQCVFAQGVCCP